MSATLIEAAKAALNYIEEPPAKLWPAGTLHRITINLRTALAAAEQPAEPVAWQCREHGDNEWFVCSREGFGMNTRRYVYRELYASPAAPAQLPLPAHEIVTMYAECPRSDGEMLDFARAIERAHGIGGKP